MARVPLQRGMTPKNDIPIWIFLSSFSSFYLQMGNIIYYDGLPV